VSAEDKGTGNKEKITITNDQNRLTPEDIERMINDAEKFADEDSKLKSRVEARNELESYAYSLKNQIGDKEKLGGKLSEEEKTKIEEVVNEKIAWLEEHQVGVVFILPLCSPFILKNKNKFCFSIVYIFPGFSYLKNPHSTLAFGSFIMIPVENEVR
jgi:molecular chaperone DnaK (HSP70)